MVHVGAPWNALAVEFTVQIRIRDLELGSGTVRLHGGPNHSHPCELVLDDPALHEQLRMLLPTSGELSMREIVTLVFVLLDFMGRKMMEVVFIIVVGTFY